MRRREIFIKIAMIIICIVILYQHSRIIEQHEKIMKLSEEIMEQHERIMDFKSRRENENANSL